jgi:xylulose-5-phosphate/fructose-6-phosphate phosphoketolase
MKDSEIKKYFNGLGYKVYFIDSSAKKNMHIRGMEVFDKALSRIKKIQKKARKGEQIMKPE